MLFLAVFLRTVFGVPFLLVKNGFVFVDIYVSALGRGRLLSQQHGVARGIESPPWDCHLCRSIIAMML